MILFGHKGSRFLLHPLNNGRLGHCWDSYATYEEAKDAVEEASKGSGWEIRDVVILEVKGRYTPPPEAQSSYYTDYEETD